jgi:hypothetical protein
MIEAVAMGSSERIGLSFAATGMLLAAFIYLLA